MYISRSRLTSWTSAKEHCHMKGDYLPSFTTSSDVKTLGSFVKNKILQAGWQSIADMMYIGYQREQVGLKRLNQAKITKKSVILFWLLNMTI